jgi:hypothetical protein
MFRRGLLRGCRLRVGEFGDVVDRGMPGVDR